VLRAAIWSIAAALVLAPAALAQNNLYNDYKKDGQVNPCNYSPSVVRKNLRDLPPDVQQYAPGLADQLRRPCGGAPQSAPVQQSPAAPTPTGGGPSAPSPAPGKAAIPSPPAPKSPVVRAINAAAPPVPANSGGSFPGWLVVTLGALAALALAVMLAGRYGGLELEAFTRPLRASLAEAGGRAGDRAGDLRDLLRLRR
jgi:cell division septation protein DedD